MRLDVFLKLVGVSKTRMNAKRLCDSGRVRLRGAPLKPSREVQAGEEFEVQFPLKSIQLKVLGVPPGNSLAKADRGLYALRTESE